MCLLDLLVPMMKKQRMDSGNMDEGNLSYILIIYRMVTLPTSALCLPNTCSISCVPVQ